ARVAHRLHAAHAVDLAISGRARIAAFLPAGVIRNQRPRLAAIHVEALLHGFFAVVGALDQVLAGDVVLARHARRVVLDVIRTPGRNVHPAPAHPLDDRAVGNVDLEHVIHGYAVLAHRGRLGKRPRKAVEQVAVRAVRRLEPLRDEPQDDVVGNEIAGIHHFLGSDAERRSRGYRRTQHVTRRYLRDRVRLRDEGGLGAFAGARRA